MPEFLRVYLDNAMAFWGKLDKKRRIFFAGGVVLFLGVAIGLFLWARTPDMRILYTNLTPEDANRVVIILQANRVEYQLADSGSTIMVPSPDVYNLRIKIAGEGSLVGQGIGLEVFDNVQMGQTEFVQHINYQRALQGELARTLSEFPLVESARVHLVMPKRSLFVEEQQPPSASVVLRLSEPGARIPEKEVQGMVNLLVSAIEGLDPNHVSITDSQGRALFTPEDEVAGLNKSQLEYRTRMESLLKRRVDEMLTPLLGPGKHIAQVNVDLDYSQRTVTREIVDPETSTPVSEQRVEEIQKGSANLGGPTDVNFRGDGLTGALGTQESSKESRTTNYINNKEVHNIVGQIGELKRMTVAVAVDGTHVKNAEGVWEYVSRTEEELAHIHALVAQTVGFSEARGDAITVSSMSFGETEVPIDPNAAQLVADFAQRMGGPLLTALLGFLFIMLVVRPVVLALIRPRVEAGEMVEGLEGLPAAEEQYALYEAQEEAAKQAEENARAVAAASEESTAYMLELGLSLDDIKARALQLAEYNFDHTIYILRDWMKHDKAKA